MTVVIIPVGSLRQRHIDGLSFVLGKYYPVKKAYILYDVDERFAKGELSVKKNAEAVGAAFSILNPEILGWDPTSSEDIAFTFTKIFHREGIALSNDSGQQREHVLIDISSTPKPVMVVSTFFAILFGLKVYYVRGKESLDIEKRMERMVNELFKPVAGLRDKLASILLDSSKNIEERLQMLRNVLVEGTARATYDLSAQSPAGRHPLEVIPFLHGIGVDFKEDDQAILSTIWGSGGNIASIKELYRQLSPHEKIELSTLTYRINKLINWGLIQAMGKREKRLELTPIGRGIARGLRHHSPLTLLHR